MPLELANQNAPSAHRVFGRPVSIWRRPSTKKPAFVAVSAETTRASDHLDGAVRLRPGGMTLRVRLHPNENLDHFAKSLKKHANKGLRKIVIFPVQFHSKRPPDDPTSRCEDYPLVNDLWPDRLARYYWLTITASVWVVSIPFRSLVGGAVILTMFAAPYGFLHGLRWLLYERGRTNWAGGTTACLHDGDVLRSGRGLWRDLF